MLLKISQRLLTTS